MRKIGFIIVFLITLLVGVVVTKAQSFDTNDYVYLFVANGKTHFVDKTSLRFLSNGRVVFWSLSSLNDDIAAFSSFEVDCSLGRARVREFAFTDGVNISRKRNTTNWFPRNDAVANRYIIFGCN